MNTPRTRRKCLTHCLCVANRPRRPSHLTQPSHVSGARGLGMSVSNHTLDISHIVQLSWAVVRCAFSVEIIRVEPLMGSQAFLSLYILIFLATGVELASLSGACVQRRCRMTLPGLRKHVIVQKIYRQPERWELV